MRIAIIGAGAGGLACAKNCAQEGHKFVVFEQTGDFGGTWIFTNEVGLDENDLPVHSAMYQGLMTNIPKELMLYPDFPYPEEHKKSYIPHQEVLEYVRNYANHFKLLPYIKFYKYVLEVTPLENALWSVTIKDAKTKLTETLEYDAVMVCNGHYMKPLLVKLAGIEKFAGGTRHSHDYRSPEIFQGKKVVIVGAGPSGRDIADLISTSAEKVFLSHNLTEKFELPEGVQEKCRIKEVVVNGAIFEDGTQEEIDEILLCTGYDYSFPFLTEECGIKVENRWVQPLYKQLINIQHPTMCLVGIPSTVCPFPLFDLQARFFLATLNGHFDLPSKEEMYEDFKIEIAEKRAMGVQPKYTHKIADTQGEFFADVAKTANITPIPPVVSKLYLRVRGARKLSESFEFIDDENFVQIE